MTRTSIIEFLQKDPRFGKHVKRLCHLSPYNMHKAINSNDAEERLFWATPYMRWVIKEGQEAGRHAYFGPILAT